MASRREIASRVLGALGLTPALGNLRSALVRDLRVLAYHRVLADFDESSFAFDPELVSATEVEFDWQMAYVARRFRPVTCAQVAEALDGGAALPERAVMVTFDDGFRDNHDVAFPVLRRHGVPAVFFVSTGYIGSDSTFWFDRVVHVLLRTAQKQLPIAALDLTIEPGETPAQRRADAERLLRVLKRLPDALRLKVLQELEHAACLSPSVADRMQSAVMTWDEVREMARAGMEFGSHSESHPILATLDDAAQLQRELEGSKRTLEHEIGRPVTALAYPVGGRDAVNAAVLEATEAAGYRFAFTYLPGTNRLVATNPLLLKRIPVERYTTRRMFATALELPELILGGRG